jgi:hypothetical protein
MHEVRLGIAVVFAAESVRWLRWVLRLSTGRRYEFRRIRRREFFGSPPVSGLRHQVDCLIRSSVRQRQNQLRSGFAGSGWELDTCM